MFVSLLKNICGNTSKSSAFFSRIKPRFTGVSPIIYKNAFSTKTAPENNSLVISESCVKRLKEIASNGVFLRITIDGGGCSGFQYKFDLDSELKTDDVCFNQDGVSVVADKISLDFLKGSTVEYKEELIRSAFRIVDNPQAEAKCSCGTSFAVKMS
ncbi:iron-sulfur cluster assembly 2 homolog, mitochondrial [Caerostris darwini]|uniref:Iron-sulfur cluster assembly 2 homolog, mitochondrial n=1 Tax=Caerostris darwini TaxID=1538125 RepID=A0AAV4QD99_9ARAC|nr:iron-sulfur cluster assembly 2 homolog, mitochondrial [Caerostris darwini]